MNIFLPEIPLIIVLITWPLLLIFTYKQGEKRKIGGAMAILLFILLYLVGMLIVVLLPKLDERN